MFKNNSVAAVVVTFNRVELLMKQVQDVVENQVFKVDEYYIIDNNSTDNTKKIIEEYKSKSSIKITYVLLPENIGGAGGFYNGVKRAFEDGHDWIILMDDDGRPYDKNCFARAFEYIDNWGYEPNDKVFFNSLVLFNDTTLSFSLHQIDEYNKVLSLSKDGLIIENQINPFNGSILSKGLVNAIGYPNKEFFIKGDEFDYNNRAIAAGAKVGTILSSHYFHPKVLEAKYIVIFGRKVRVHMEAPWKEYYTIRNFTYSSKQLGNYSKCIAYLMLRLFSMYYYKCDKCKTSKMIIKGFVDGLLGRLGKRVSP